MILFILKEKMFQNEDFVHFEAKLVDSTDLNIHIDGCHQCEYSNRYYPPIGILLQFWVRSSIGIWLKVGHTTQDQ